MMSLALRCGLLIGLLSAATAGRATELGRIDPAGIPGALILVGPQGPDDALDRFYALANGEKARIVILRSDDEQAAAVTERLRKRWSSAETQRLDIFVSTRDGSIQDEGLAAALKLATGVWVIGDDAEELQRRFEDKQLRQQLEALASRGGVLGGASLAAAFLAQRVFDDERPAANLPVGLGLLPHALVGMSSEDQASEERWATALPACPGTIGFEIDPTAAMMVRGRRIGVLGEGSVRVRLAASETRPAKQRVLEANGRGADLTALRKSARERLLPPFPSLDPPTPNVDKGALIIIGGGGMPKGIVSRFIEFAGGEEARIVVLPTAMPDPISEKSRIADAFRKAGAADVTVLPGRTRDVVESDEYLETFRKATGIWFDGGRQWRFADAYLETKALPLMHAVLERGGVIMGSSAGASIQADYLARANPLGNRDIMAEGYERGLGFIQGVAIDQHFAQRRRFADMTSLMQRYPQLLGIGIDESTALVVQGKVAEIVGKARVHFYDRKKPLVDGAPDYESVAAGGRYNLATRTVLDPGKVEPKKDDPEKKPADKTD